MDYGELFEDRRSRCGPPGGLVVRRDVRGDSVLEIGDGFEDAASDFAPGDGGEEPFNGIEPRRGSRGEMERPSRMTGPPFHDPGMRVGGVIIDDAVDELAGGNRSLHGVEETDELRVPPSKTLAVATRDG